MVMNSSFLGRSRALFWPKTNHSGNIFSLTHCLLPTSDTPNVMHELVELHFVAFSSSGNFFACSAFCLDGLSLIGVNCGSKLVR